MIAPVIIIGAGGHGRVLADALLAARRRVIGFTDADPAMCGLVVLGLPVLGDDAVLKPVAWPDCVLVNGIGDRSARRVVQARLEGIGWRFTGVRHPEAIVSSFAKVDETAQLLARAIVQAGAEVGPGCIVNTGAIVEHGCCIGDFTHCAPGSILCGDVRAGSGVLIGAGAVVREGITLGDAVTVGAGAVVVRNYAGPSELLGVPAKEREVHKGLEKDVVRAGSPSPRAPSGNRC